MRVGSGKSAVVNALIAGFGHRANTTGRNTNSAKSLIKNGKDCALIQMHLANGGKDAESKKAAPIQKQSKQGAWVVFLDWSGVMYFGMLGWLLAGMLASMVGWFGDL